MRSLYESIIQSRFGDRKIEESILDDNSTVIRNTKNALLTKVENFVKEFFYAKFCKFDIINE